MKAGRNVSKENLTKNCKLKKFPEIMVNDKDMQIDRSKLPENFNDYFLN